MADVRGERVAFAGQNVQFRFVFDTMDSIANTTEGWYVDDVQVARSTAAWSDYYSVTVGPATRSPWA